MCVDSVGTRLVGACQVVESSVGRLVTLLCRVRDRFVPLGAKRQGLCCVRGHRQFGSLGIGNGGAIGVRGTTLVVFLGGAYFGNLFQIGGGNLFGIPVKTCGGPVVYSRSGLETISSVLRGMGVIYNSCERSTRFVSRGAFICFSPPCHPVASATDFATCARGLFGSRRRVRLTEFISSVRKGNTGVMVDGSSPGGSGARSSFFSGVCSSREVGHIRTAHVVGYGDRSEKGVGRLLVDGFWKIIM